MQLRDLPSFLHMTNLSTEEFLQDDLLLTSQQQIQIIQNALASTDDELLGLKIGQHFTPQAHGALGLVVNSSPHIMTMLEAIKVFVPTRIYFARVELVTSKDWVECHLHLDIDTSREVIRALSEMFAMAFTQSASFILGRPLNEVKLGLHHDTPSYSHHYLDYLPGTFHFSRQDSAVSAQIPINLCYEPNAAANSENYELAYKQCEVILNQLNGQKGTLKYQIQQMILAHPSRVLTEETAAAEMFISKRTLARRLKKEGISFRQIKEDTLSQQATSYLTETNLSIEAIAALLNYHDSANFRRAFKRWFNMTPSEYRENNNLGLH